MALQIFKEMFNEKYDGVTPATMLPVGAISDGKNIRKVSVHGGWKVRKGSKLHNTTALAAAVKSLHYFKHPRNLDVHFLAQANSNLYDATDDPPTESSPEANFGSSIRSAEVGTTPGFSDVVGETWFYGDGNKISMYGGDSPYCTGFLAWDNSTSSYTDSTRRVIDANSATLGIILSAANDVYYVCSPCIASAIVLTFSGTLNTTQDRHARVKAWRSGSWTAVTSLTDGTATGTGDTTATHAQNGTLSWTAGADTMTTLCGIMGYWYQVSFWDDPTGGSQAALGAVASISVLTCKVTYAMATLSNKWSGIPEWVTGCIFYDASVTQYQEGLGKVSNAVTSQYIELDSMTSSDVLYLKTPVPATGFGLGLNIGHVNTNAITITAINQWDGDSWESVGTLTDETLDGGGTKTLAQTGYVWWNGAAVSSYRRTFESDPVPGYWYQIVLSGTASDDVQLYAATYVPFPESLPNYDGVVQFKNRLLAWGDPEFPNRLRYSAKNAPDCFCGSDSGYTDAFGDNSKILCALRFYNELVVFKEKSVWLLEGDGTTFGTLQVADRIGLASPKTAHAIEVGHPAMHNDEKLTVVIWQDVDGVYLLDGRKPIKISSPVDNYFNPESSTCIAAASIRNRQAFVDVVNNEWHLLLPSNELVYNYLTDEWYPVWDRALDLDTGLALKGTDDRWYTYGGTSGGFVQYLETDTTDKNASNADVAIDHYLTTRAISADQKLATTFQLNFRGIWIECKARTAGTIVASVFTDGATSGTTIATPAAMSMVNSGKNFAFPHLDMSQNCMCLALKLALNTADQEMEVYSFLYALEIMRLGDLGR